MTFSDRVRKGAAFFDVVVDDFYFLAAVTPGLFRLIDDNFFNKLMDDGGRELLNLGGAANQSKKAVHIDGLLFLLGYLCFQCGNRFF